MEEKHHKSAGGELLAEAAGTGDWMEGMRFSSSAADENVQTWVDNPGL